MRINKLKNRNKAVQLRVLLLRSVTETHCYLLEGERRVLTVLGQEILAQSDVGLAADLIAGLAVGNTLDDSTLQRRHRSFISLLTPSIAF